MGILMMSGLAFAPVADKMTRALRVDTDCFSWKLFQITRTFLLVCLTRICLATRGVESGFAALISIIKDFDPRMLNYDSIFSVGLSARDARIIIYSVSLFFIIEIMQESGMSIRETLERQNMVFQWLILLGGMFAVLLWGCYGIDYNPVDFIYQRV